MKITKKDKMIISELLDDGRMRFSDLGSRCKISRQTAFNRVKQLKNSGVIEKFTVRPSRSKLGLDFRAYILVTAEPGKEHRDSLLELLKNKQQISQIHNLFGRFDFFLEVVVADKDELAILLNNIHQFESVTKTETFIVCETLKYEPEGPMKHSLNE